MYSMHIKKISDQNFINFFFICVKKLFESTIFALYVCIIVCIICIRTRKKKYGRCNDTTTNKT